MRVQLPDTLVDDIHNKAVFTFRQSLGQFFSKDHWCFQMNRKMAIPKLHIKITDAIVFKQRSIVDQQTNRSQLRFCLLQQATNIIFIRQISLHNTGFSAVSHDFGRQCLTFRN